MRNYLKHSIKGASITFILSILAAFFGYLFRILLARYLSPSDFGLFFSVYSSLFIFTAFKTLGLNQALAKFIPEFLVNKRFDRIKNIIGYSFIFQFLSSGAVALVFILLSSYLAAVYFKTPLAVSVSILLALAFWFQSIESTVMAVLRGLQKIGIRSSMDVARSIVLLVFTFVGFQLGYGITVPALAYVVVPFVLFAVYAPFAKRFLKPCKKFRFRFSKKEMSVLFRFSLPVLLSGIGIQVLQYTDTIFLTIFTNLQTVGYYNAAISTVAWLTYFGMALVMVTLPLVSELFTQKKLDKLRAGLSMIYRYIFLIIIPFSILIIIFANEILSILFGLQYVAAAIPMVILAAGTMFLALANINFSVLAGLGKPKITTYIISFGIVLNIITNFILIPLLGMTGAAITTASGYLLMMVLSNVVVRKKFSGVNIPVWSWIKNFFVGVLTFFVVFWIKNLVNLGLVPELFLIVIIVFAVYGILAFLLRLFRLNEILGILRFVKK